MTRYERKAEVTQLADEWSEFFWGAIGASLIYTVFALAAAWLHAWVCAL